MLIMRFRSVNIFYNFQHLSKRRNIMIICPKCNKQLEDGTLFCDACGENLAAANQPAPEAAPAPEAKKALDIKKLAVLGVAAVAIIALVIFLGSLIFGGGEPNYALYIKDGEMQFTTFGKSALEVTDNLYDGAGNAELSQLASRLGMYTHLTKDGNKLFYVDKADAEGFTLYVRNPNKPKEEPIKIDSGINYYLVNEKGTLVTYIKYVDGEGTLYQHNLKDKTKIKSEVEEFVASIDGKKILFQTEDGSIFLKDGSKDPEKVVSEADSLQFVNKDFSKIYYTKENNLYLKKGNKDAEKLCSDVGNVIQMYDSGAFYYTKAVEEDEEGDGANASTDASDIAENVVDQIMKEYARTLCFFDGKESKTITDKYYGNYRVAQEREVIIYTEIDEDELTEKNNYNISEAIKYNIAVKADISEIKVENISGIRLAKDGKTAYVITTEKIKETADEADTDSESDENAEPKEPQSDLYKIKIGSKPEAAEKYDEEIYASYVSITDNGNVIYFKEVKNNKGELYVDKTKIDDDVKIGSVNYLKDSKKVVYYSDWNEEKAYGTLEIATLKGKTTKIADDVTSITITPTEDVLYIKEYKNNKGELYRFSGNKSTKLDEDVVAVISYNSYTNLIYKNLGWID